MARVDHLTGGIYRISTYAPEKRISFNQFLIDDDEPALIHTGTFPMYADVRSAITEVLDPSRLRHVIVPHFEADECDGMGRFVAEAPNAVLACSALSARINLLQWDYAGPVKGMQDGDVLDLMAGSLAGSFPTGRSVGRFEPAVPRTFEGLLESTFELNAPHDLPKICCESDYVLQHAIRPEPQGRVLGFDLEFCRSDEADYGHEIDHGFELSLNGFIAAPA